MNNSKELQVINKNNHVEQIKSAAWMSLSKESQKAYQSDFKLFFDFIQKDPKKIGADDIIGYINHLEEKGFKNSTINRKIASLSKMFKVMNIAGEIKINPIDVLKQFKNISRKVSKEKHVSLTLKEIKKATKITKKSTKFDKRTSIIIRMLARSGLRISEFINIKHKDIVEYNEVSKKVRIVGKGKKERFIFIQNDFLEEVYEIFPCSKNIEYLFYNMINNKYNRVSLYRQIRKFFKKTINKDVHPHKLRHWFFTHKISVEKKDIKAVSKYGGHSSVSTTLDMYVDTTLDSKDSKIKI